MAFLTPFHHCRTGSVFDILCVWPLPWLRATDALLCDE